MRAYLLAYRFGAVLSLMEAASRWKQALRQTRSRQSSRTAISDHNEPRDIYAAHGSMFGLSRTFFERGGRIGYESFLYGEEIHIAEQSRRLGLRVRFEPSLVVRHEAKAVTGQQHVSQRRRWKYDSMRYLFQTYFRTSPERS